MKGGSYRADVRRWASRREEKKTRSYDVIEPSVDRARPVIRLTDHLLRPAQSMRCGSRTLEDARRAEAPVAAAL